MKQYLELLEDVLTNGERREDRTGTGTIAVFDRQLKFDLQDGFPLVTTKRIPFRLVKSELLWMVKGRSDLRFLLEHDNNIWNEWPFKKWVESEDYHGKPINFRRRDEPWYEDTLNEFKQRILADDAFSEKYGDLGPVYGVQWRRWRNDTHLDMPEVIDQLQNAIDTIVANPHDRQNMVISAWNPTDKHAQALPPCHYAFQLYVRRGKYLDLKFHQRSADVFLGLPFDIASYATLTHMIAALTGLTPGRLTADLGDTHIYINHISQVEKQLMRRPKALPTLTIWRHEGNQRLEDFSMDDIVLENYRYHAPIKAEVSV